MRYSFVLLMGFLLSACGKTGALFLPEEPADQPAAAVNDEPAQEPGTENDGNTD